MGFRLRLACPLLIVKFGFIPLTIGKVLGWANEVGIACCWRFILFLFLNAFSKGSLITVSNEGGFIPGLLLFYYTHYS
jgi:hypothetical protein